MQKKTTNDCPICVQLYKSIIFTIKGLTIHCTTAFWRQCKTKNEACVKT